VPIFNIGAAFWGLVFGFAASRPLERGDFRAVARRVDEPWGAAPVDFRGRAASLPPRLVKNARRKTRAASGRKGGKRVNSLVKTYPQVSQFWTYDPKAFLANPVCSRDDPPSKNLEP